MDDGLAAAQEFVAASDEAREVLAAVDRLLKPQGVQVLLIGDKPGNDKIGFVIGRVRGAGKSSSTSTRVSVVAPGSATRRRSCARWRS